MEFQEPKLSDYPSTVIKEARERVRAAIKNSQLKYPTDRLLINLTPAGMKKEGAGFDLAIALAILRASDQIPYSSSAQHHTRKILVFGELELSGKVRGSFRCFVRLSNY